MEDKFIKVGMNKVGGFKEVTVGIVMVALFSFSLLTFGFQIAVDNNSTDNIFDDPVLSGVNDTLREKLGEVRSTTQEQRSNLESQEAQEGSQDEGFGLTAIVGAVFSFFGLGISMFNVIFAIIADAIGIPSIVLNVLVGVIILVLVLFAWRVWKVGGT